MPEVDVPGLRPPGDDLKYIPESKCLFPDNVRRIACPIGIIQNVLELCQGAALVRDGCQDPAREILPVELVNTRRCRREPRQTPDRCCRETFISLFRVLYVA